MRKLDICDRCQFCAHSPHLVCSLHPSGVDGKTCLDFRSGESPARDSDLSWYEPWHPENAAFYGNELVVTPVDRLTIEQRLELLDWHPLFTGKCPQCGQELSQTDPPRIHWDCSCGWKDDSL